LKADQIFDAELHISQQACDESAAKIAPIGSLLILVRGMGLANGIPIGEVTSPVAFNQDIRAIIPPATVDSRFLLLALRHSFADGGKAVLSSAAHGTLKIDSDALRRVAFPVPPLHEQRRIVAILDEAFQSIATAKSNTEKTLLNAREMFDGHLQTVFTHLDEGWVQKRLQDVCEKITDGTHQTPKYFDSGVVFLSSKNVTSGKIDWESVRYIDDKQHIEMHRRAAPRLGDILLAKNGTTGVAAIVDRDTTFDIYVSLAMLRSRGEILPRFLLHFINSPVAKMQFNRRLKGVGVPNLHLEEIREVLVNFPRSHDEQRKVLDKVDELYGQFETLKSLQRQKLSALDALKKSLLHQAFTGQLVRATTLDCEPVAS
jgi:type I restriction enzyme S subunit